MLIVIPYGIEIVAHYESFSRLYDKIRLESERLLEGVWPVMQTVYVVSDLHMFCKRSQCLDHLDHLHRAADLADLFVFNGDTFDFKWTTLPSVEATVEQALNFLADFARKHPNCQIHVNLGNHDHIAPFIKGLNKLERETENLSWHPFYLRVNNTVFLHGDVANRKMRHHHLERYRAAWMRHKTKQGLMKNRIYDAAFRAKAHVAVSRLAFLPHRRTTSRVTAYLDDIGHGEASGVDQVYFGHTHVAVRGYRYRGVTFHNGGAPMHGMEFTLLKVKV